MTIDINVPDGKIGNWEIRTFEVSADDAIMYNLREGILERFILPGTYKGLYSLNAECPGRPIMSNTPSEILDHLSSIEVASGRVLIFGLGLGMVVQALIDKPSVKSIRVIEIEKDVIELSGKYYEKLSKKVNVIQADAFTYNDSMTYDAAWFDIWDSISEDNLGPMKILKNRWKGKANIRMCWAEKECKNLSRIKGYK